MTRRIVAAFVLTVFTLTNSIPGYGFESASRPNVGARHASPLLHDVNDFRLPSDLGTITDRFILPAARQTVILIQDAHAIPDAQRSIQKIIEHVQTQYGVGFVGVEGAASELDPQIFRSFPDKNLLRAVGRPAFEAGSREEKDLFKKIMGSPC